MMPIRFNWRAISVVLMSVVGAALLWAAIASLGCASIQKGLTYHVVEAVADRLEIPQQGVTLEEMIKGLGASTATLMAGYLGLKLRGRK